MKPFLGIDLTTNKKNEATNGEEFIVQTVDPELSDAFYDSMDESDDSKENEVNIAGSSRLRKRFYFLIGAIIVLTIVDFIVGKGKITFLSEAYQKAPAAFYLFGAFILAWVCKEFFAARKKRDHSDSGEGAEVHNNYQVTEETVLLSLGMPFGSPKADILAFSYAVNDKGEVRQKGLNKDAYLNIDFHISKDSNNLYLTDLENKYAIPLSELKDIRTVDKTISLVCWNKDEDINSEVLNQMNLRKDKYGDITCSCYHILEFVHNNELWGIYFPSYELPIFEEITGLKAETI